MAGEVHFGMTMRPQRQKSEPTVCFPNSNDWIFSKLVERGRHCMSDLGLPVVSKGRRLSQHPPRCGRSQMAPPDASVANLPQR